METAAWFIFQKCILTKILFLAENFIYRDIPLVKNDIDIYILSGKKNIDRDIFLAKKDIDRGGQYKFSFG